MNFDNPLFLIPVLTGLILVITGITLLKMPPKKINGWYGYRTSNSMLSQDRWKFSQTYAAKELIKFGTILALVSILSLNYNPKKNISTMIGLGFMLIAFILPVIRTEKAIKIKFGEQ